MRHTVKISILFFALLSAVLSMSACGNTHDTVEIYNKSEFIFDNIKIELPDRYYYSHHEKLKIDNHNCKVVIYFSDEDLWQIEKSEVEPK